MFYKLFPDGSIQGRAGLPQDGWQELPDCPFEYAKLDGKKWIEDTARRDAIKADDERNAIIDSEIKAIAEERLIAAGKISAKK